MKKEDEAIMRCEASSAGVDDPFNLPFGTQTPVAIHVTVLFLETMPEEWNMRSFE